MTLNRYQLNFLHQLWPEDFPEVPQSAITVPGFTCVVDDMEVREFRYELDNDLVEAPWFAIRATVGDCDFCGRPLPPYLTSGHRVIVGSSPDELLHFVPLAKRADAHACIVALPKGNTTNKIYVADVNHGTGCNGTQTA